jgi:hypothetical protein
VRTDDAEPVKRTKISILLTLCTVDNHQALLREFVVRLPNLFRGGVLITALDCNRWLNFGLPNISI